MDEQATQLNHLMIIPDGDRRYAQKEKIPVFEAYKKAAGVVRNLVDWVLIENNINEFTFFGLSYNNVTKRSDEDLEPILEVQTKALNDFAEDSLFHDNKIKVSVCGQKHMLPKEYLEAICNVERETKDYTNKKLNLLLGYSGRLDFEQAIQKTLLQKKSLLFDNILYNCEVQNEIDFIIRTANENRLSDGPFFLTKSTEFHSIPEFFPELTKKDISIALSEYSKRKRTFGV